MLKSSYGPWIPISQPTSVPTDWKPEDDYIVLCRCRYCGRTRARLKSELEMSVNYNRCDEECYEVSRKTSH